jgi:hypothetical protein
MTHDEIIAVIAAHRDGKPLQQKVSVNWVDFKPANLEAVLFALMCPTLSFRPKPELRRIYALWDAAGCTGAAYSQREYAEHCARPDWEIVTFVEEEPK